MTKPRDLSIGELAKRANVATSRLRFYERAGLLKPIRRQPNGYRLYAAGSEKTLHFIRRAQRLGFSLGDIELLLKGADHKGLGRQAVVGIAEQRFLDIERRVTELLVMRHELELFLEDLTDHLGETAGAEASRFFRHLFEHVCGHEGSKPRRSSLDRLIARLGCSLAKVERERIFTALRGQHVHIWREEEGYSVLIASRDKGVEAALRRLAASEADCHAHVQPGISASDEGILFSAQGPNAFLFAQLFLALEASET